MMPRVRLCEPGIAGKLYTVIHGAPGSLCQILELPKIAAPFPDYISALTIENA